MGYRLDYNSAGIRARFDTNDSPKLFSCTLLQRLSLPQLLVLGYPKAECHKGAIAFKRSGMHSAPSSYGQPLLRIALYSCPIVTLTPVVADGADASGPYNLAPSITSRSAAATWPTAVNLYSTRPCPFKNAPISLQRQRITSIQVGGGLIGGSECEHNRCAAPFESSEETIRESDSDTYELVCVAIGDATILQIR